MKTMMRAAGAAAVGLVLGAGGAMADGSVSGTVNVTATVDATCTITGLNSGSFGTADFSNSGSSLILTTTFTSTKPADCNVPTHITVTSNNGAATKITSALASAGGYASYFDYTVTAAFGGSTATLDTSTVNHLWFS